MMEEKPFRVLLDFSEVNPGISGLKYVWMHVSPRELKTIDDFKQAIVRKFSFPQEGFKLFVRDGLLLETERIAILREDDTVKIQFENPRETSVEYNTLAASINVSAVEPPSHSISSNVVSLYKSHKRKSETFTATSKENDNLSANISKKKKKRDKTLCISDERNDFSSQEDLSNLDKNSKANTSRNKEKDKKPVGKKKKSFPKTPTSDFINFAIKLSEAEKNNHQVLQSDVNDKKVECSVSDTNLYKTAEFISKSNLSPIPEKNTYVISDDQAPLILTESPDNSESQVDCAENMCKKRRRKRKRKIISAIADFSTDAATEMEGSFLADVKHDETYNTSSGTRKHIIFRSPSPPKRTSMSLTLDSELNNSSDEPNGIAIEKNVRSSSKSDRSKSKSVKEETQTDNKPENDCDPVISDLNKESTPFSKKKLKEKSWGVTPLPRMGSCVNNFSVENIDVSKTDVKPAYENYTPLNSLPPVGTRLAFKILELNEDYCPEVSEYKEGILRKVDPITDELKIEFIEEEIKPGKSGKFENLWKDEPPLEDQVIRTVLLKWTALIDPRLIP